MSRKLLIEEKIHTKALRSIEAFHEETLSEVIETVSKDKVVVVGMSQNPVVKKARNLLDSKGMEFTYLEYGSYLSGWQKRLSIKLWSGWSTFPQVFIDGKLVGGYSELNSHLKE